MITLGDRTVRPNRILKQKIGTIKDIILRSFLILRNVLERIFKCQNVSSRRERFELAKDV